METILLVGPKHSGKTSAGRALARIWAEENNQALPFTDLDELVEARTGKSPRALYGEGPDIFRKAEAEALRELFDREERGLRAVAAGGGLADNGAAMDLLKDPSLKRSGRIFTVYLEVPAETAWKRIEAAAEKTGEFPPFLKTGNPRETHRQLHLRRGAIYREIADLSLRAGESPEETAALIARSFRQRNNHR
ncbi:MAG: shikimate kinase [Treponema sp.]|nr:shikimate kinase [Treponema sp.]